MSYQSNGESGKSHSSPREGGNTDIGDDSGNGGSSIPGSWSPATGGYSGGGYSSYPDDYPDAVNAACELSSNFDTLTSSADLSESSRALRMETFLDNWHKMQRSQLIKTRDTHHSDGQHQTSLAAQKKHHRVPLKKKGSVA